MPRYIFVCGCPRSGTTMLAQILNGHPKIALGIERYGNRFFKEPLTRELFEYERFHTIEPGDTFYDSLSFSPTYEQNRETFNEAKFVGDKIPLLFTRFAELAQSFPKAKVVFCLRNIVDVAASYEVRARNPEDTTWARDKGAAAAVQDWNSALAAYHAFRDKIDISVFNYDRFQDHGEDQIKALMEWMGLGASRPILRRVEMYLERSRRIAEQREQPLDGALKSEILRTAAIDLYRSALDPATPAA